MANLEDAIRRPSPIRQLKFVHALHRLAAGDNALVNPPQSSGTKPKIGLVLIGGASEGGGGTGRRFARLFQHLQAGDSRSDVWLITKPEFLELMERSSIPIDAGKNVLFFRDGPAIPGSGFASKLVDYRDASARLAKIMLYFSQNNVGMIIDGTVFTRKHTFPGSRTAQNVFSGVFHDP